MKACVVISEQNIKKAIAILNRFSMAEVRLDLCQFGISHIREIFSSSTPAIATYRESDPTIASKEKMDSLKIAMENGARYIDLEYQLNAEQRVELMSIAKNYQVKVIISYHDFEKTPDEATLNDIINQCNNFNAYLIKIATKVNFRDDCFRLFNLYHARENLIAFGMGEDAKFTRITSLFLGAPFTYVHFTSSKKTAEGQLGYREFEEILKALCT